MVEAYEIEKHIWSNDDFDVMGWHDARVYSTAFIPEEYEFRLDLDYIFKWVEPSEGETYFSFWIAPSTMCFENASDIEVDVKIGSYYELEIVQLNRTYLGKSPNGRFDSWLFEIELNNGSILLKATGYKMYVRSKPTYSDSQVLPLSKRGGVSVEKT